jgi:hypothetical protein
LFDNLLLQLHVKDENEKIVEQGSVDKSTCKILPAASNIQSVFGSLGEGFVFMIIF